MSNLNNLTDPFQQEVEEILKENEDETENEQGEVTEESAKDDKNEEVEVTSDATKDDQVNITVQKSEKSENQEESPEYITICVDFPKHATPVECVITATGYRDKIAAAGRELRLLQNRLYMIPVDCDENIDSDDWAGIKIMSDIAESIDVRYVKNKIACVMPLKHNVKLRQGNRLAILW